MRDLRLVVALAAASALLGGCGGPADTESGSDGGCNARVRLDGVLYRVHSDANDDVPVGKVVGTGDVVGCGGADAPPVDTVEVHRIRGVDVSDAVVTIGVDWRGVYLSEELAADPSSWPEVLQR